MWLFHNNEILELWLHVRSIKHAFHININISLNHHRRIRAIVMSSCQCDTHGNIFCVIEDFEDFLNDFHNIS